MQQRMFRKAAIALAVTALAACQDKPAGLDLTPPIPPPGAAVTYILNGATDSPNLSVALTDAAGANAGGTSPSLGFGGVLRTATAIGAASLSVDELLPSDLATSDTPTQQLLAPTATTVNSYDVTVQIVTGTNVAPQVMTATANGGAEGYGLGSADILLADAAPASATTFPGGIAYYFTDADATHLLVGPTGNTFGFTIDPFLVSGAAGLVPTYQNYRLFVVDGTNPNNILFDSGSSSLLQPPSGGAMILALIDNPDYSPAIGNSPFRLFNSMTGTVTADTLNVGSMLSIVQGTTIGGLDGSITNVAPAFTPISNLAVGAAPVTACGVVSTDASVVDFWATGTTSTYGAFLGAGFDFTAANALFLPSGDPAALFPTANTLKTRVLANDSRTIANEGRVRFVNLANSTVATGDVLVYVNPTGTVSDATIQAGSQTENGTAGFGAPGVFPDADAVNQPFVSVAGGNYDIRIATGASGAAQTIIFEQDNVAIAAGTTTTQFLVDGSPNPTLTQLDNTAAACP